MAEDEEFTEASEVPTEAEVVIVPETSTGAKLKTEQGSACSRDKSPVGSGSGSRDKSPSGQRAASPSHRDSASSSRGQTASSAGKTTIRFKVATQEARVSLLRDLHAHLSRGELQDHSLEEADEAKQAALDVWQMFASVHDQLVEQHSGDAHVQSYMMNDRYRMAFSLRVEVCQRAAKIRSAHHSSGPTHVPQAGPSTESTTGRPPLPEISLPSFSGEYSQWAPFRDMFTALVRDNAQITDVEKMHYLLTAVTGEAAKLISSLPISGASLTTAWHTLMERYNNKRALVTSHLDVLLSAATVSPRSAQDLHSLLHSLKAAYNALESLGAPVRHWDWVIVHSVSRRLDARLREAWELKAGQSDEPPSLSDLRVFLTNRARALEQVEPSSATTQRAAVTTQRASTTAPRVHTVTTSHASGTSTSSSGYACSYCKGSHYIVACPAFRRLTHEARRDAVVKQKLCFNCLGKHSVSACQGTTRCKECDRKHHTMIHTGWSKYGDQPSPAGSSAGTTHAATASSSGARSGEAGSSTNSGSKG